MDEKEEFPIKTGSQDDNETISSYNENSSNNISTYPPIEEDELEKHRCLNEEAEKNNSLNAQQANKQSYLERLKLKKKAIAAQKARLLKRKMARKSIQHDFAIDPDEFMMEHKPTPPPKPKFTTAKPVQLVLGFKYSYAVQQYYLNQMKNIRSSLTFLNEIDADREDVMNGSVVKTLGPAVLNMKARTLPSCNPIELRLRTRMQRNRKLRNRSNSRASSVSTITKLQESFSLLNKIDEKKDQGQTNISSRFCKVSSGEKLNVIKENDKRLLETDRDTELPAIKSFEKMFITAPKNKKDVSLKLPVIGDD